MWTPETYPFLAAFSFVIGLLWGSYFNVAIYRWPLGMSTSSPRRSFCFRCGTQVGALDNIPVLSWLLLRGRCRSCGAPFSFRYAAVELLTGLVFLAIFLVTNPPGAAAPQLATLWYWAFAGLLIIGTFTDIDHWIIPDGVTLGGAAAALVASLLIGLVDTHNQLLLSGPFPALRTMSEFDLLTFIEVVVTGTGPGGFRPADARWFDTVLNAILGAAVGPFVLYGVGVFGKILFRKDAMGLGDVKLFALIGATLGVVNVFVVLMLASLLGTIGGLGSIIAARLRTPRPSVLDLGRPDPGPREGEPPVVDIVRRARAGRERPPAPHHLPFGPWIALAALVALLLWPHMKTITAAIVAPGMMP